MTPGEPTLEEAIRLDRAYRNGMALGWNLGVTGNHERFAAAHENIGRQIHEALAALSPDRSALEGE